MCRALTLASSVVLVTCGETVTQIDPADVVELLVSTDSARIGVGRTLDLDALTLDQDRALLFVGQDVGWTSSNASVVSVDADGLLTGEGVGSASVVASFGALRDTTFVTVVLPPVLVISSDSVGLTATAGGSDPAPDTVNVTNGGVLDLVVSVDSIVYGAGATGWLTAQLSTPTAPATLALSAATSGVTTAGTYVASVWLSGVEADDSPAVVGVTLRIVAGTATSMTLNDGNNQTRTVGTAVTVAPSVLLVDQFGNPAVGAAVTFAVTGGAGQIAGSPATVNAAGVARVGSWTLGTVAGANQLTATHASLTPVVFSATGTVGSATQVVVTAGNNQSAVAGAAVGVAPSVSVRDQHGNGVTGVAVTFAVTSGGGSITGASQTSGAGGIATLGSWTLGTSAGSNTLSASAAGVATPAVITATALSGAADSIYYVAGNAQTDTVAATLPVAYSVRVVDTNGNGVAGIPIAWTATFGGGSITPLDTTDANGFVTAVRVLGTVPGADSAVATVGGLPGSPVRFGATATVGSPDEIRITSTNPQTATVRTNVASAPQVTVEDKFDNPIQGHSVTFSVLTGAGVVSPTTSITTLANGTATVAFWQLGDVAGTNNNTLRALAAGTGITGNPRTFTASGTAAAPASIAIVQGSGQTTNVGAAVSPTPTVVVRDQYGNGVPNIRVNFAPTGGTVSAAADTTGSTGQAFTSWFVNVTGLTMQTNGTFTNTMSATVNGTAITTSFTGAARYSYSAHVHPLWGCGSTCHGPSGGLLLTGTAADTWPRLVGVTPVCDGTLGANYKRVSAAGGVTAADDYSILLRIVDSNLTPPANCVDLRSSMLMSTTSVAIIRAWIRNGAPYN